jgi:tRNA(fMet)-specific endonuclease VapC
VSALVIDTSSWILYFRGRGVAAVIEEALAQGRVHLPPVVAAELLSAKLTARRRKDLEELLADLPLCGVDRDHWFRVGSLRSSLFGRGLSVSTPDAHVAQCALDLQAELLAEDSVFALIARHRALRLARR